jgi:hypothetical protein
MALDLVYKVYGHGRVLVWEYTSLVDAACEDQNEI